MLRPALLAATLAMYGSSASAIIEEKSRKADSPGAPPSATHRFQPVRGLKSRLSSYLKTLHESLEPWLVGGRSLLDQLELDARRRQASADAAAQHSRGAALEAQGKFDEAIAEYTELLRKKDELQSKAEARILSPLTGALADDPTSYFDPDLDPGPHLMEAYANYSNRAAKGISRCLEAKEDIEGAIDWAIRARDKYSYQTWCGTCAEQERIATTARIVKLLNKAGRTSEARFVAMSLEESPEDPPGAWMQFVLTSGEDHCPASDALAWGVGAWGAILALVALAGFFLK